MPHGIWTAIQIGAEADAESDSVTQFEQYDSYFLISDVILRLFTFIGIFVAALVLAVSRFYIWFRSTFRFLFFFLLCSRFFNYRYTKLHRFRQAS